MTYLRGRLYFVVSLCCVSILCQRSSRGLRGWLDTTFQPRQKPLGSDLLAVAAYLGVTRAPAGDSLFFLLGFIAVVSGRFNFIVIVVTSDIKGSLGVGSDTWGIVGLWSLAGLLHGVFFFFTEELELISWSWIDHLLWGFRLPASAKHFREPKPGRIRCWRRRMDGRPSFDILVLKWFGKTALGTLMVGIHGWGWTAPSVVALLGARYVTQSSHGFLFGSLDCIIAYGVA